MAYTPPNVFVNATSLNAAAVQGNNDTLKAYVDGNVLAADVSSATWVRTPHIMRGTYIPLQNLHEFTTGVVRGGAFESNDIDVLADRFRTPYPSFLNGNENVAVEFTNETVQWYQRLGWQVFPKHPPLKTTPTTTVAQLAQMSIGASYKANTCQENDAGSFRASATFGLGIPGVYRRRAIQNWEYKDVLGAAVGSNVVTQWYIGTNNIVNVYADFGYNIEVWYE